MLLKRFLILFLIRNYVNGAKILGIFPMTARSHYILGSALMAGLAEKGHDVTLISPFQQKPNEKLYRDIVLTGFVEEHDARMKSLNLFNKSKMPMFLMVPFMGKIMTEMTEKTLNHSAVQELIHSDKETFDVVIVEEFMNQAHKAFAHHFSAHLVVVNTMGANAWVNNIVGNPTPLAYVPDILLGYTTNMTFFQRTLNTINYLVYQTMNTIYFYPSQRKLIHKYFPKKPNLEDVMYNTSLVLLNSHGSVNHPVPYVPQMIDIGGFHVKPPKKLPKDLQDYLDNSKNGVILFSLGSNIKSYLLPVEKRQALINTFSQLKENVLWKWEEDELPGKPDNVRLGKWLPQLDILAHPNVKLFITHAGLLSTIEIIYHGVPVLALPIGGDQQANAQLMENQGIGLKISIQDITEENLLEAIQTLLKDTKYRENAKLRSQLFHDRLTSPMDTAIYWIEYVMRNNGAKHLRAAGLELPWYKYFLIDVLSFLLFIVVIILYVSCKITKVLFCWCRSKKTKTKQQ